MKRFILIPALAFACTPPVDPEPDAGPIDTPVFEAWDAPEVLAGRWGHAVADRGDGTSILFGGTRHNAFGEGAVQGGTFLVDATEHPPTVTDLEATGEPSPRYCGCAAYDASRDQVLHVAGRDLPTFFPETYVLDVAGAAWTQVETTAHPDIGIACALAWSESEDAYYLYGGGGPTTIIGETWTMPGGGGEWTQLTPAAEPPIRYDAAMRSLDGGDTLLLIGGGNPFDANNAHFADVWTFDPVGVTWTEVVTTGGEPEGRRVPWLRLTPDESELIMGFGSYGFEIGQVNADLWRLDLGDNTWSEIDVDNMPDGRGFSKMIPGGAPGVVGYLLTGFDGGELRRDTHALRFPEGEGF
jgi:hypothetical protein